MVYLAKNQKEFLEMLLFETSISIKDQQQQISANKDLICYCVLESIFLPIAAMLAGEESIKNIVDFQINKRDLLKRYLPFEQQIPAYVIKFLFSFFDFKRNSLCLLELVNSLLNYIRYKHQDQSINLSVNQDKFILKICNNSILQNNIVSQAVTINNKQNQDIFLISSDPHNLSVTQILLSSFDSAGYRLANNMLALRNLVIDIIKMHKVRKCSKLGINIIRRLASNNPLMLIELIDNWVYN